MHYLNGATVAKK